MVISTASDFTYEFIPAPRNREGIVLEVRSGKAVHFALSEDQEVTNKMYQVIIGDQDNSISWIGRGKHGKINLDLFFRGITWNLGDLILIPQLSIINQKGFH